VANESIWISGRAGEKRVCGGCHEDRAKAPELPPGQIDSALLGAVNLDVPRKQRVTPFATGTTYDFSYGKMRGVPWDKAIQPIFDAKCVSCHDGDASKPGNPTFTVTDMTSGTMQTFTFDLRGQQLNVVVGERMTGAYTASYISVMGLGEIIGDHVVTITGNYSQYGYVEAGSARDSSIIKMLNPPQRFPAVDMNVRAFPGKTHAANVGYPELTADEYYRLILNIDMGGQFYFRENKDTASTYITGGI